MTIEFYGFWERQYRRCGFLLRGLGWVACPALDTEKGIRPDVLGCPGASVPAMLDHDLMRSSETCSRLCDARLVAFTGWHFELLAGSIL